MSPGSDPPFLFIVGSGRSGTTLLRSMLNAHPDIAIPDESHFVATMGRRRRRYEAADGFRTDVFVTDLAAHYGFRGWGLDASAVGEELTGDPPVSLPEAIRRVFALYARAHGKRRYGDKTPIYVLHLAMVVELFPEARIVHVIRDGRDVALSFLDQDFGPRTITEAAIRWNRWVGRGRSAGRRLGPGHYAEVRYESLVSDPEPTLRGLCGFLNLPFDPAMLRYFESGRVAVERDYYRSVLLPPTAGLREWHRDLSPEDVRTFEALAGGLLSELGYERGAPSIGPIHRLAAAGRWASVQAGRIVHKLRKGTRRPGRPSHRVSAD